MYPDTSKDVLVHCLICDLDRVREIKRVPRTNMEMCTVRDYYESDDWIQRLERGSLFVCDKEMYKLHGEIYSELEAREMREALWIDLDLKKELGL